MKEKKARRCLLWIWAGILTAFAGSILFTSLYGLFGERAEEAQENPIESAGNIERLYSCNQILYRDLYNNVNKTDLSYAEFYFPFNEELSEFDKYLTVRYPLADSGWARYDLWMEEEERAYEPDPETEAVYPSVLDSRNQLDGYYTALSGTFGELSKLYDYEIVDVATGKRLSNTVDFSGQDYCFLVEFDYDEAGNMTVGSRVSGEDPGQIRRYASDLFRTKPLPDSSGQLDGAIYGDTDILNYMEKRVISGCRITYGMSRSVWEQLKSGKGFSEISIEFYPGLMRNQYYIYSSYTGLWAFYFVFLVVIFFLAMFLPYVSRGKPWEAFSLCRMPLEGVCCIGFFLAVSVSAVTESVIAINTGTLESSIYQIVQSWTLSGFLAFGLNLLVLSLFFFAAWYLGICVRMARDGIWEYVKERSLIYRFFPFIRQKVLAFYEMLENLDLTKNAKKTILRVVLVNALILFVISSLWVGGFFITGIYSVILYFILKKYVSDIQKRYGLLLNATNEIAEGRLDTVITESLGIFEPFRPQIYRIQQGFRKAVEEEVKSQRMKTELITNVSHDLKTPLTAIITYVNLLKDENLTEEKRREYLDTLERKSMRLKALIEDLFEVSKAASRSMPLNIVDVDIMNLVKQVELEISDKLKASHLEVKLLLPEEKVILPLDSQKTYRIYENLFSNIAKYALPGTRVYVSATITDEEVTILLKNISAEEISLTPAELTDRFVRGDASRNTEGSGLGLAIVKSFTELQGGRLEIEIEDDLFKVKTIWKRQGSE